MQTLEETLVVMPDTALVQITKHPAFVEVEKLGMAALPLIFRAIKEGDAGWTAVLASMREGQDSIGVPKQYAAHALLLTQLVNAWSQIPQPHPTRKLCSPTTLYSYQG